MTQTTKKRKKDLSHIDTLADLMQEKRALKVRLKQQEKEIEDQWKKLPAESFKLVVRKVVPFYLNNKVLDKSWGVVSALTGFMSKGTRSTAKKEVLGNAKKLGLFTAIRAGYNFWKNKKK